MTASRRSACTPICVTPLVEDDAYDVMIFDCPPSFSLPCISAIAASDTVIVPIKPGAFEMSGMRLLADQIASVRNTGLAKRSVFGLLTIWHTLTQRARARTGCESTARFRCFTGKSAARTR